MKWIIRHKIISAGILVVIALAVVCVISFSRGGGSGAVGRTVNGTVTTGEKGITGVMSGLQDIFGGVFNYKAVVEENQALKKKVEDLQMELSEEKMTKDQLEQLQELSKALNYKEVKRGEIVSADITSFDESTWINVFTINRGTSDGIAVDDVVVNGAGLVGRVFECGKKWAKVVSILDDTGKTSFMVSRDTEVLGMLTGDGKGSLTGYALDAKAGIIEGDILLSSGIGIYPKGIEIGTVKKVQYNEDTQLKMIKVEPAVNFKGIQKVTVII